MSNVRRFPSISRRNSVPTNLSKENVKVYLIGTMRIEDDGGKDVAPKARKTRAMIAYLSRCQGKPVSRSRLAGLLWERSSEAQARTSVRHAISELVNGEIGSIIKVDRDSVWLDTTACWVDVFEGPDQSDRLLDDFDEISPQFDQWLAGQRARFEDRVRTGLEANLKALVEENAKPGQRAAAARKLINFDPTHEIGVRALMTAFLEMGDQAGAIREFERYRQSMQNLLDLPPSKETLALYEVVRLSSSRQIRGFREPISAEDHLSPLSLKVPLDQASSAEHAVSRPSIAVLHFQNLSGDTTHDYAGDGLVDDLIEVLSRVPNLLVISRLSTLAFRNEPRQPREIGTLLGVQYVLSGSMRVLGDRLRLTVELTDTATGTVLWVSRLDERFFDLFEVQNRLADAIVRRVAPQMHVAELKRTRVKRADHLGAYDLFLRAQENMHNSSREVFDSSERLFDEVIRRDPNWAIALAWRAYWHVLRVGQGWSPDPEQDAEQAARFAQKAVDSDPLEPMAFAVQGHIASYLHKDFKLAFQRFKTALDVNPNAAPAWLWSGAAHAWVGNGARAVEEINKAIALSPYDPLSFAYNGNAGMAYLADGQFERAVECGLRSIAENRTYTSAYKLLVLALMLAGRESEAQGYLRKLLELEPGLTVESYRRRFPGSAYPTGQLYSETMAKAGLPLL